MFGHKTEADAVVITREKVHESSMYVRSGSKDWHHETWRFVLEVHPQGAEAYRVGAEEKIRVGFGAFTVPDVGNKVRVEYEEKEPDKIQLVLEGDARYDDEARKREDKAHEKAEKASSDASYQAALDAPPGTSPDGQPSSSDGEDNTQGP